MCAPLTLGAQHMNSVTMMVAADEPEKQDQDTEIAIAILRASLTTRCQQAGVGLATMVVMAGVYGVLLGDKIDLLVLVLSQVATSGMLLVRYFVAVRAKPQLPGASYAELKHFDNQFRLVSLMTQLVTGAAIWIVWNAEKASSPYVMTLLICLYAIGTMINLAQDARSFQLTVPVLMVHPVLFWFIHPKVHDSSISFSLAALTILMIFAVRNSQRTFEASVRIRFEKDELLGQVERALHQERQWANLTELANREKDTLLQEVERGRKTALGALKIAEEANQAKSFFMAAASHDLRQPLYAATIVADTLALHELSPKAAQLLEQQRRALSAARALFDNLLDLSRFESGTIEPNITAVSVKELLRNIEAEFSALCGAKGLTFTLQLTEHHAFSDYDLLDRMVRNLLSNAVRYTLHGSVGVELMEDAGSVILTVTDTGIGIAAKDQERIFNEFVQLHNPQRASDKGAGLGLAIVRHIAKLLNHTISVHSVHGEGTRMSIRMPQAAAVNAAVEAQVPAVMYIDLRGREVWIVENDRNVREALSEYFAARGCVVGAASESRSEIEELIDVQGGGNTDYVLIDDMLGEHEFGLDVAHWLSQYIDHSRIMIMTGNADPKRCAELKASPFEVMRKPITAEALNEWVAKVNAAPGALRVQAV